MAMDKRISCIQQHPILHCSVHDLRSLLCLNTTCICLAVALVLNYYMFCTFVQIYLYMRACAKCEDETAEGFSL